VAELERFLIAARLDAVGVFGYSDEDGTEAESLPTTCRSRRRRARRPAHRAGRGAHRPARRGAVRRAGRGAGRRGRRRCRRAHGRAGARGGRLDDLTGPGTDLLAVGDLVRARVVGSQGVDLVAELVELHSPARRPATVGGASAT
jgi:tRNA A37 methylthiotransferase MiaB